MSTIKSFLSRNKIGAIERGFVGLPKGVKSLAEVSAAQRENLEAIVADRVRMMAAKVETLFSLAVEGMPVISRVDVLVFADQHYADADCGLLAPALEKAFAGSEKRVFVHEVKHGDLFCGLLNYGVAVQMEAGCRYSLISSAEAASYFTPETVSDVVEAAAAGARAIGVAINELTESILEGRLANTFALWRNRDLLTVGGFDLRAAKPTDDKSACYMKGFDRKAGDVFYPLAGVEEVIPLARMVETFGPCLAPIVPRGDGVQAYRVPDPAIDPEGYARHYKKMGTKMQRQAALLAAVNKDLTYLEGGVLPQYRG